MPNQISLFPEFVRNQEYPPVSGSTLIDNMSVAIVEDKLYASVADTNIEVRVIPENIVVSSK